MRGNSAHVAEPVYILPTDQEEANMQMDENTMFLNPSDTDLREQLIFGRNYSPANYTAGGICHFDNLRYKMAAELVRRGFLSPEDKQNEAPTAQEFIDFMKQHDPDNWILIGYAISPTREDVRVSIEGIESVRSLSEHDMVDFLRVFRDADKLIAEDGQPVFGWYD